MAAVVADIQSMSLAGLLRSLTLAGLILFLVPRLWQVR